MKLITSAQAKEKLQSYAEIEKHKLSRLRDLVIESAQELKIAALEESLKWGEISYLTKNGSTVRIDIRDKKDGDYAIYFKCTSKLVTTFKEVFGDTFSYENNRAIVFTYNEVVPKKELKKCIKAALRYHHVKNLEKLGIT